jgi:hypothetical protein
MLEFARDERNASLVAAENARSRAVESADREYARMLDWLRPRYEAAAAAAAQRRRLAVTPAQRAYVQATMQAERRYVQAVRDAERREVVAELAELT